MSLEADSKGKFVENGYYDISNIVYQIQIDGSDPPKGILPLVN